MNLSRRKLGLVASAASVATMAAALVAGGGAVAQASSAPAGHITPFAGVFHPMRNVGDNLCLQPVNPVPNSPVVQEPCDGSAMQGWQYVHDPLGGYDFINQASGACLNAFIKAENGAPVGLDTCRSVSNERWDPAAPLPNVTSLQSMIGGRDNGYCLDVPGASNALGLQVQLWTCNGTLAQRWVIGFD